MFYNHLKHYDVQQSEFMKLSIDRFQHDRQNWKNSYEGQYKKALERIEARNTEDLARRRRSKYMKERVPETNPNHECGYLPVLDFRYKKENGIMQVQRLQKEWEHLHGKNKHWLNKPEMNKEAENCATKKLLYKGVFKEDEGRFKYLDVRKRIIPENRYNWLVKDSWKYGWNNWNKIDQKTSPHARVQVIKHSFYRKNKVYNTANQSLAN